MRAMSTILRKEVVDALRDRRSMASLLLTALFGPIMMFLLVRHQASDATSADHLVVPVLGAERAPAFVGWLARQDGVTLAPALTDPDGAVQDGRADAVLVIDQGLATDIAASTPARVRILSDSARARSAAAGARLTSLLASFSGTVAASRLIVRGISPRGVEPLDVVHRDVSTSGERGALLLNVALIFLSVAVLGAGMQIATDSTAGERERGSLEALLLNPVARWHVVAGKWLAAVIWASGCFIITLLLIGVILARLPLAVLGIRLHLDSPTAWAMAAAMGPLVILAPAIQIYVASFAKSFKEAQSYSVFLVLPMASIGLVSALTHTTTRAWMAAVPLLAQYVLGSQVLAGRLPGPWILAGAAVEAGAVATVFLVLTTRLFSGDRMISRP